MPLSYCGNVTAVQEERSKISKANQPKKQRSVGILSVMVVAVGVVLMVTLSICLVVTASLVSHSAKVAQCPDWLWVRDSVQLANAATDCRAIQPIF